MSLTTPEKYQQPSAKLYWSGEGGEASRPWACHEVCRKADCGKSARPGLMSGKGNGGRIGQASSHRGPSSTLQLLNQGAIRDRGKAAAEADRQ